MEYTNCPSKRTKDYWAYLEENYEEVRNWPSWMRGESSQGEHSETRDNECDAGAGTAQRPAQSRSAAAP